MKKLLLLLVGAVVAFASHAQTTVRFYNSEGWNNVFVWAWIDGGDGGEKLMPANGYGSGFGDAIMTYNAETGLHEMTFSNSTPNRIIFGEKKSDDTNGAQTDKRTYNQNNIYNGKGDVVYPRTIYFYDTKNSNLTKVCAYLWDNSSNSTTNPGVEMRKLDDMVVKINNQTYDYPVWKLDFYSSWTPTNVIINKGVLNDDNKLTGTSDGKYTENGVYTNGNGNAKSDASIVKKVTEMPDLYLRGDMNGWSSNDDWKFSTTDKKTYTLSNVTIANGKKFKIAKAGVKSENSETWDDNYNWGGNGSVLTVKGGESYVLKNEGGSKDISAGEDLINVTLTFVPATNTLTISESQVERLDLYLRGTMATNDKKEWLCAERFKFTPSEDNRTYTLTGVSLAKDTEFKVAVNDWNDKDHVWGAKTNTDNDVNVYAGNNYNLKNGDGSSNLKLAEDLSNVTITFVPATGTLTISHNVYNLYLIGDFNNWKQKDEKYRFISTDGVNYTLALPETISLDKAKMKINNGTWDVDLAGTYAGLGNPFAVAKQNDNIVVTDVLAKGTQLHLNYNSADKTGTLTIGQRPTKLYFHVKYDIDRHGQKNHSPYVWLYNKSGYNETDQYYYDESKMGQDKNHRKMTMVHANNRYSLWTVELSAEDLTNYNACAFYFRNKADNGDKVYRTNKYVNQTDVKNYEWENGKWAKYIYATATASENGNELGDFAAQTYLTPDEFEKLVATDDANGGHDKIYLVGGVLYAQVTTADNQNIGDWDKIGTTSDGNQQLSWKPMESRELAHDNRCFYLPIRRYVNPSEPDKIDRGFKISWINTAVQAQNVDKNNRNDDRAWATFDLGLIGVDKDSNWVDEIETKTEDKDANARNNKSTYYSNCGPNGVLCFVQNKSVPYMNYNQANWKLPDNNKWYCLVVDTHPECHTATITTFNPHPTVKVKVEDTGVFALSAIDTDAAEALHNGSDCLFAANSYNGHVHMTKLNTAAGTAEITATPLTAVSNANFARTYYFYSNNVLVKTIDENAQGVDLKNINLDYMPLTNDITNVAVRAMYKDNDTDLTFHSRTGDSDITVGIELNAPTSPELKGKFVWEGTTGTSDIWGVYITGLDVQFAQEPTHGLHDYSDFVFDQGGEVEILYRGTGFRDGMKREEYPADASAIFKLATQYVMPEVLNSNWKPGEDWSTYLRYPQTSNPAPIFIHDVLTTPVGGRPTEDLTITGNIYIVHPFIYLPEGDFSVTAAPRRVGTTSAPASLQGFKVSHTRIPAPDGLSLTISANDVVSAVEMIGEDAANADAEVEYYTISGIRVMGDPAPGIYVKKQGTQVTKVVIK